MKNSCSADRGRMKAKDDRGSERVERRRHIVRTEDMAFLCMSLETETAAQFPLAGMPPFSLRARVWPSHARQRRLLSSISKPSGSLPLLPSLLTSKSRYRSQSSRELAAVHTTRTDRTRAHTCSSTTAEEKKEEFLFQLAQEEPSLGPYGPRTPWLPSPPASPEQADSIPPPRTPCELPIARATSPSSPTSTSPTTY